jgi:hypothetical protein
MRTTDLFVIAAFSLLPLAHADGTDGPYVMRGGAEAWWVDAGAVRRIEPLKPGATLAIPGVGDLPAFQVKLRPAAKDDPDSVDTRVAPLFVVADTHGEYEILAHELVKQRVLDAKLRWTFGRGHLVLLGDVFDRGPNQLEILWLLYGLEAEALKAGGGVHLLLGNHETMMFRGDLRYLNPKYSNSAAALGVASYPDLFAADSVLGQWLRTKSAVLRIDGYLCLHGGISPALVSRKLSLAEINGGIRAVLKGASTDAELDELLMKTDGPLWYRGYFDDQPGFTRATDADIDRALAAFGAKRILIGHTIVPTITSLYGGKVIAVQVYPKHEAGAPDHFEALFIEHGKLFRALPGGQREPLAN